MEEVIKFLEKVGVDNQVIAQLKDPEEGLNVDELADEFKASQKEVYANNPDLVKDLEKKAAGKARGSVEREVKRVFDITIEEWEQNNFGEEKDYKKVLAFAKEKMKKSGNQTLQEIQDEKTELVNEVKRLKEEEIPGLNKSWQDKIDKTDIDRHYRKMIGEGGDLIVSLEDAVVILNRRLSEKGHKTELLEDRTGISFKTKDDLALQDKEGTRNLSNLEVVKEEIGHLYKQSNAPVEPQPTPKPVFKSTEPEDKGFIHPAAKENLDKVKDLKRTPRITKGAE